MKKKNVLLTFSLVSCCAIGLTSVVMASGEGTGIFAAGASSWVHYARKEATETTKGIREYWVQCGGSYQFTDPGVSYTEGTTYNTSEFEVDDDRYIYPVSIAAQEVLMTDSTKSISLGDYADLNISSITADTINLGTNPAALDVSGFNANHSDDGEKTVKVNGTKNGLEYTVFVPTTFITATINDQTTWNNNVIPEPNETIYGYYKVTANLNITTTPAWVSGWDKAVFSGTVNGDNHTITLGQGGYGQFYTMKDATIKNATFTNTWWRRATINYMLFAQKTYGSHFENITTKISGVKPEEIGIEYSPVANYGYLFGNGGCQMNSFKDCLFDFGDYDMPCLLSHSTNNKDTNTFENCTLKCYSYTELYSVYGGGVIKTATGLKIKTSSVTPLELENQDIFVNSTDPQSVSLAGTEYASDTVSAIEIGTYSFGTDLSNLSIPAALKSTPTDHGEKTMYVTVTHAGDEVKLSFPVTLVTGTVSTVDDVNALRGTNLGTKVYGYYIVPANATLGALTNASYKWAGDGDGFYGTLDGRGHTLTYNTSQFTGGLFGTMCVGSCIKNVTLASNWFSGGWGVCLAAYTMFTVNLENVTCKATAGNGTTTSGDGLICAGAIYTNTWKNVKVESAVKLGSIIKQDANATKSTFTNCTVDAPAVLGYVGTDLTTPGWSTL